LVNVRGFNLFAAFLGVIMLAISVGFGVYTFSQERQAIREVSIQIQQSSAQGIADIIREDAHNLAVESIRTALQKYFANNDIIPPKKAWEDEDAFKQWFSNDFIRQSSLTEQIADTLASELLLYQNIPMKGWSVSVVLNRKTLAKALSDASTIQFAKDGTIIFIYDSSKLSKEELAGLPTIVVRRGPASATVSVFPPGRWMVPVPLRVLKAYEAAREFRTLVSTHLDDFRLLFGMCDTENSPDCALYRWTGAGVEPVYPEKEEAQIYVSTSTIGDKSQPWTVYNLITGGCTDIRLYVDKSELNKDLNGQVEWIPCADPAPVLYVVLQKKLTDIAKEDPNKGMAFIDPSTVAVFKTWKVYTQQGMGITSLISAAVGLPIPNQYNPFLYILKALGEVTGGNNKNPPPPIIPISPCKEDGYLYCAAPVQLAYTYVWTDKDTHFSATGKPAVFRFRTIFTAPFSAIYLTYETRQKEVEAVSLVAPSQTAGGQFNQAECEEKAKGYCAYLVRTGIEKCAPTLLKKKCPSWLKAVCEKIGGIGAQFVENVCGNPLLSNVFGGVCTAYKYASEYALSDWDTIRSTGHELYEELKDDQTCARMFAAFKDNDSVCMNPHQNFCEKFSFLSEERPGICPNNDYVAYSYFWFHPFSEFGSTCSVKKPPEPPAE